MVPTNRRRGRRRQHWLILELLVTEVALTAAVEGLGTEVLFHTGMMVVARLVVQPTPTLLNLHLKHGKSFIDFIFNSIPLIPACTARPGLPLSPPEIAFLESPYYRPQTASIADRHHPTNFHSVTYTQSDDAAFEAGSDNDHKSFLRMRVISKVEYPAELFRFRRVLDDILSSFDVF